MPLLQPSSAFLTSSIVPLVKRLSLADLRRVHAITAWPLATTLPPPSVPRTGILAPFSGKGGIRVPQFRMDVFKRSVACLLYAGCAREIPLADV